MFSAAKTFESNQGFIRPEAGALEQRHQVIVLVVNADMIKSRAFAIVQFLRFGGEQVADMHRF